MITHRGIWAIAHMLSHSLQTFIHSWRISPQTFVNSVSNKQHSWTHIALRVQQTHRAPPLTKARIGLERQRQTCAVWAKRTEYSIEQIRQSLQRLKIAKIVRIQNLHNFRTIGSVFFRRTFAIQIVNHWHTSIAHSYGRVRHNAARAASFLKPPSRRRASTCLSRDIWTVTHMLASQVAALKCFHCVTKVRYS